jgi:hypothetical protein
MGGEVTSAEHLQQAKERALEYADAEDVAGAIGSLTSDLGRHPETAGHPAIETMTILAGGDSFARPGELRRFIEGIH